MRNLAIAAMFLAAGSVVAAEEPAGGESAQSPLRGLPEAEKAQCSAFGETYLRIAEMRDAGGDKSVAVNVGVDYLAKLGATGTHVRGNYKGAVEGFAEFVYANPRLNNRTLYLYGISSCAISKTAPDDAGFERAMTGLEKFLGRCQVKFPGDEQVDALGKCVLTPVNQQLAIWAKQKAR